MAVQIAAGVLWIASWTAQAPAPSVPAEAAPPAALLERLKGDAHFAKLPLKAVAGFAPIDLVLQEPYGARPGWEAAPSNRFGPWARELVRQFEERFARPFALVRDGRFGPPSLIVLASEGDLVNYRRSASGRSAYGFEEASYAHAVDAVVVSAASAERPVHLARYPGLHLLAWRELAAHAENEAGRELPLWIEWGLPTYLAWSTGFGPDALRVREIDRAMFIAWHEARVKTQASGAALLPLLELVAAADAEAAGQRVILHAGSAAGIDAANSEYLSWCAAALWTHYLNDGEGGRWRDGYGAYLAGALRGAHDTAAFRAALQLDEAGIAALETRFQVWLGERGRDMGLRAPAAESDPPAQPDPQPAEPAPALAPIAPQPAEVALAHGAALVLAREGDLDGAIAALEDATAVDPEGALAKRVGRDLERARGFRELRARFLAELAANGKLLQLERDGKRVNVRVAAVERERITLREARGGMDAVPFAQLSSVSIARAMGREYGWMRAWPYALVDDPRGQELLDAQADLAAVALRADAAEWYPGALRLGLVARELAALGGGDVPNEPEAARALAERIGALVREHGALPEVELRRPALRALAAAALERGWSAAALADGLAGRFEALEGGRARLTYTFDEPAEYGDFELGPLYPPDRFESWATLLLPSDYIVENGRLAGSGSHTWRLPLVFRTPLSMRVRMSVGSVPEGGNQVVYWALGVCDDRAGNLVLLEDLGSLLVIDRPAHMVAQAYVPPFQSLRQTPYAIELAHDGGSVRSLLDGKLQKELAAPTRSVGEVLITVNSDTPLAFDEIAVEGLLDEDVNRARWIERRLTALGL